MPTLEWIGKSKVCLLYTSDQRGLTPLPSVREGVVDLGGVDLGQGDLVGTLQGFVHRDGSPSVCCVKVQITRL